MFVFDSWGDKSIVNQTLSKLPELVRSEMYGGGARRRY